MKKMKRGEYGEILLHGVGFGFRLYYTALKVKTIDYRIVELQTIVCVCIYVSMCGVTVVLPPPPFFLSFFFLFLWVCTLITDTAEIGRAHV